MVGAAVACEWESKCNGEPVGATTLEERERETDNPPSRVQGFRGGGTRAQGFP